MGDWIVDTSKSEKFGVKLNITCKHANEEEEKGEKGGG